MEQTYIYNMGVNFKYWSQKQLFLGRSFECIGRQRQRELRGHRINVRRHNRDLHRLQFNGELSLSHFLISF